MRADFHYHYTDEPHASRRREILAKYPEIKRLFGHDPATKYKIAVAVFLQFLMAWMVREQPWAVIVSAAYLFGGTLNHMMMLAIHEVSHNLAFKHHLPNRLIGLFANLPVGVPASASFKRYHMDHHRYQGRDGVDVDIPTVTEARLVTNWFLKLVWVFCQCFCYAVRPLLTQPKPVTGWEVANMALCIGTDLAVAVMWGWKALAYLLLGSFLGMGLHPVAGHFIAEHYVFAPSTQQETYSYYGPLNWVGFNVGYHNEHHDFPFIPGSRLPEVRRIAPEFYDPLPHYSSWCKVVTDYIADASVGPFSRVKHLRPESGHLE
jgi:sphingolipid delta-4 desaturase